MGARRAAPSAPPVCLARGPPAFQSGAPWCQRRCLASSFGWRRQVCGTGSASSRKGRRGTLLRLSRSLTVPSATMAAVACPRTLETREAASPRWVIKECRSPHTSPSGRMPHGRLRRSRSPCRMLLALQTAPLLSTRRGQGSGACGLRQAPKPPTAWRTWGVRPVAPRNMRRRRTPHANQSAPARSRPHEQDARQ